VGKFGRAVKATDYNVIRNTKDALCILVNPFKAELLIKTSRSELFKNYNPQ
jgi:hypothetical protein